MTAAEGVREEAYDFQALEQSPLVQMILRVISQITGMRISLVARITDGSWTACAVHDEAGFGLNPGDQLELASTY